MYEYTYRTESPIATALSIAFCLLEILAVWKMYQKMGKEGWESIIPFYCNYVLFEELYGNGWKFLTLLIPFYNIYVAIKLQFDLAKGFGQSTGFGFGLLFLSPIFYCILGFDNEIDWIGLY